MARDTTKSGKSESLTIRLDPKIRFILEYVSKMKGQTITTVVERAIVNSASDETVIDQEFGGTLNWHDFWDVSEGVRFLKIASRSEFFPSYEDDKRVAFCKEHWPFFWATKQKKSFLNHYVDVLWPRIDEFQTLHDDNRGTDYFAAGKAMQAALKQANLKAPEWPIKDSVPTPAPPPSIKSNFTSDLDDDIPF
ncbi:MULTISPECIES: hypothetical protein [unclassified Rhizobium]|uniref:hypothetical protein n=1 Tax=unclassified Rhizobium TaxID=2613769 RepID=UPI00288A664A|nr:MULTISPECIES: hypothetical protein [unclassified Rhizobium]